ncbi:Nif3-like dinuclear metal center hexameric protein [Ligilactobacillus cholophilus]|uniref:Nif3-like dinuclear metal center hexameric protein n=1 Tax=Ligilactobacillus cholophilus TaxID=3050131 RepID=UPI0025B03C4F|nr:Nif3-like dinuclear metal center hexameric protein [Ligilactobacillus cholophilus]
MTKVKDIVSKFEELAPKWIAEDGDPVGLQLGDLNQEVHKMMVTLDVRPETVQEAIDHNVDFIFAHHPAMFRPVQPLDLSIPQNKMYAEIIKHGITVYGAHTNLDNANGGMNDWLAEVFDLQNTEPLLPTREEEHSYTGSKNEMVEMVQKKIEVFFPERIKKQVLFAMHENHPQEDFIYDLYQVEGLGQKFGMGRVGELPKSMTVKEFAEKCNEVFDIPGTRVISKDINKTVKRIAILGGSGARFYTNALQKRADLYLTGDISYHVGHDILASGLNAVDAGHYIEYICKPHLTKLFSKWNQNEKWNIDIYQSEINTNPYQFI